MFLVNNRFLDNVRHQQELRQVNWSYGRKLTQIPLCRAGKGDLANPKEESRKNPSAFPSQAGKGSRSVSTRQTPPSRDMLP